MANSYACIANDGVLMKPYVIKKELAPDGSTVKEYRPTPIRTVVSKKTAETLNDLLIGVVERGTGKEAKILNMKIAGKTGTSQKVIDGEYSKRSYTSSFIGYFPADDPQIVVAVIIDAPKSGEYYGGLVAAPIFKKISERVIAITGLTDIVQPDVPLIETDIKTINNTTFDGKNKFEINLKGIEISDAIRLLKENNINCEIAGPKQNSIVVDQEIIYSDDITKNKIKLVTKSSNEQGNIQLKHDSPLIMPEVKGMSIRKCVKILSSLGIEYKINGSGRVIQQSPEAGAKLSQNKQVEIKCSIN
jgi:membrane peptidoglycan carboxypeptidase